MPPRNFKDFNVKQAEPVAPKKLTFVQKLKKRWYLHLISFCISTIVISMLLTYVAMPKIAQHDVDGATLHLDTQIVSDPTPTSVHLHVENTATSFSLFTPQLDGINASLFLENTEPNIKPFGYLQIPTMHATKSFKTIVDQTLDIVDMEQFIAYNTLFTQSEKFRFALRGRTVVHLGALPSVGVDFNKAIETNGLNGFKGVTVSDVNITLTSFPDGSNMKGNIHIPNPSVMTLTIGNMVQDIFVDGVQIGNTTIENVVLRPGDNLYPMSSTTNQSLILPLLSSKYKDGKLPVVAKTRTSPTMATAFRTLRRL